MMMGCFYKYNLRKGEWGWRGKYFEFGWELATNKAKA